ncbi:transposase [Bacillus sp. BGMRC 2118]|nr:transposase [Bacillus sp. BGMRC 2118]
MYVIIKLFHIDRGSEFKNKLIDDALATFNIQRSLSIKGYPCDNAVAEAPFNIIKTAFIKGCHFDSLQKLENQLQQYVNWSLVVNIIDCNLLHSMYTHVLLLQLHLMNL